MDDAMALSGLVLIGIDYRERDAATEGKAMSEPGGVDSGRVLTLLGSKLTTTGAHPIPLPRARFTRFLIIVDFPAFAGPRTITLGPASRSRSTSAVSCPFAWVPVSLDFAFLARIARRARIRRRSSARWRFVRKGNVLDVDS